MTERPHWLYRSENLPKLWALLILILALVLLPDLFLHHHAHFPTLGFQAGYAHRLLCLVRLRHLRGHGRGGQDPRHLPEAPGRLLR